MKQILMLMTIVLMLSSCSSTPSSSTTSLPSNTYIPIMNNSNTYEVLGTSTTYTVLRDYFATPTSTATAIIKTTVADKLLKFLPNVQSKILIEDINYEGGISFSVGRISGENKRYRIIIDQIMSDTDTDYDLYIQKIITESGGAKKTVSVHDKKYIDYEPVEYKLAHYQNCHEIMGLEHPIYCQKNARKKDFEHFKVATYFGVGIRLIANLTTDKANIDISGLNSIKQAISSTNSSNLIQGISATAVIGTIEISTMGLGGPDIIKKLPVTYSLSEEGINSAIIAVQNIKDMAFTSTSTVNISPQILAFSTPFQANQELISRITSLLINVSNRWNLDNH